MARHDVLCEITGVIRNIAEQNDGINVSQFVEDQEDILDDQTGEFRSVPVQRDDLSVTEQVNENESRRHTRRRVRRTEEWKRNIRHKNHQAGEPYLSSRGKEVPKKVIKNKKDCFNSCKYNCSKAISEDQRLDIFTSFYNLSSQNEKYHYILQTTHRKVKKRSTTGLDRKKYTYIFYFYTQGSKIRVCKQFYLSTLTVSQKMVYGVHEKKNFNTGAPQKDCRGLHGKQVRVPNEHKNKVRQHINSFPVVESHYCRASTQRRYLETSLSIAKMYEQYIEEYEENKTEPVIKKHMYTKIFNEEFNLSFLKPKKDRCDKCSEWEMAKKENVLNEELNQTYNQHQEEKNAMRRVRKIDRDSNADVLCFDLQNVLTCPQAEVSCFFYKSKLNVYNLTAHFSRTKKSYCCLWTEVLSGRSGNDLASALQKILQAVYADNPDITSLILWSDSCVPQNRNSLMSYAITDFLKENENIMEIVVKYSTPGHSGIQEVDNVHSCIERVLSASEYYSPVSLIKLLKKVNRTDPYKIIQLDMRDIKDFGACAKVLSYEKVPYTKVTALRLTQCYFHVFYKTSHLDVEWASTNILSTIERQQRSVRSNRSCRSGINQQVIQFPRDLPTPAPMRSVKKGLPEHKVQAIKSMLKWMPLLDRQYYNALFREIGA